MRIIIPSIAIIVVAIATLFFYPSKDDNTTGPIQGQSPPDKKELLDPSSQAQEFEKALRQEAEKYISDISGTNEAPLNANEADDFVNQEQTISLGQKQEIEEMTVDELRQSGLPETAPITLVQEQEEIIYRTSEQILLDANNDLNKIVKIQEDGEVIEMSVKDLLVKYPLEEINNIAVIEKIKNYIITTPKEINKDPSISAEQPLKVIKKPYALETTSVGELLMGEKEFSSDTIFYVRKINKTDQYGIWGVIQNGLVNNFAKGIAIKRAEALEKYQVDIPKDADERLEDQSSSFLGQLIQNKSRESYVYNFEKGKMGRNPDLIYPGQELVIISFTPNELVNIYQHFVAKAKR